MPFLGCIFAAVLAVTPQANLSVVGATKVRTGSVVAFDASQSRSDFPLAWAMSPSDGAMFKQFPDGAAWLLVGKPGKYDVVLVASGWQDEAKTSLIVAVATATIDATDEPFPPQPPLPPQPSPRPTEALAAAAFDYHKDLNAAYGANYRAAADAIRARSPLRDVQARLRAAMKDSAQAAFTARFAPWAPLLPPDGTEPTTDAQWRSLEDLTTAVAGAFQ